MTARRELNQIGGFLMKSGADWLRRQFWTYVSANLPAIFLGLALLASISFATGTKGETDMVDSSSTSPIGEIRMGLLEAIARGVENNLDVEIERHSPFIASESRIQARGAYDPIWFGEFGYFSDETPVASSLQDSSVLAERRSSGRFGLRGLLPSIGGEWEVGYRGASLESNSSIQSLSPSYDSSLTASATLPLLRGLKWTEPWLEIHLSKIREDSAFYEFKRQLVTSVMEIEINYWVLVATQENLKVATKSLETAKALKAQTVIQHEVGTISKIEVIEAEAGVAEREVNLISAKNSYWRAQDVLVDSVLGSRLTPDSQIIIIPTDAPEVTDYDVEQNSITKRAFQNRSELAIARREVRQHELQERFARNQRLPQLDLIGTLGYAGLAGKANSSRLVIPRDEDNDGITDPPRSLNVDRDFSDTDDDFFGASGAKSWSVSANFSVPLGNVKARSTVRSRALELRRAKTRLKRLEQAIILEARTAIRDLQSAREGIKAAERRRLAAEEQLRAEKVRLEYGESTPFDALQRERDLVEAESQKIAALQRYRESIATLDAAQGTILEDRNILIEDTKKLR